MGNEPVMVTKFHEMKTTMQERYLIKAQAVLSTLVERKKS